MKRNKIKPLHTIETTMGYEIQLMPIQSFLYRTAVLGVRETYIKENPEPLPPTYTIELIGDEVEHHPITPQMATAEELASGGISQEDYDAYHNFLTLHHAWANELSRLNNEYSLDFVFRKVIAFEMPTQEEWEEFRASWTADGVSSPETPDRQFFFEKEMVGSQRELSNIIAKAFSVIDGGLDEGAVGAISKIFQLALQGKVG